MRNFRSPISLLLTILAVFCGESDAFSSSSLPLAQSSRVASLSSPHLSKSTTALSVVTNNGNVNNDDGSKRSLASNAISIIAALTILAAPLSFDVLPSYADEWGKETEAPTFFTGETTMICKKRGPLGACTKQVVRTTQNDNDKADKYFKDPSPAVVRKQSKMRSDYAEEESEGNKLIQKLRLQSEENREKNDLAVLTKTLINDQSASFGPFSKEVVILNTDGRTFMLLTNPQAMRLKKAGYIEDRKFVTQPSQEVIDEALENPQGGLGEAIGAKFKGLFGGGNDDVESSTAEVADTAVVADVLSIAPEDVAEGAAAESVADVNSVSEDVLEGGTAESMPEASVTIAEESS